MLRKSLMATLAAAMFLALSAPAMAQNPSGIAGSVPTQLGSPAYTLTALSATAAVNNQVTLTIPAPTASGYYNYVCSLTYQVSQDGTATAATNSVTTSTNFNAFALKYSVAATANLTLRIPVFSGFTPGSGCIKSASATTATTFVSPSAAANSAFTWETTYYQAP